MSVDRSDDADGERDDETTADDADAGTPPTETEFAGPAELRCGIALDADDE
ncbi:hypothetical protein [Natronoarchaeum rubrum]|uniref:hypothetical protein n=1 Tax=Natronoarchaeum rubrum TaxID=755311 RepID=UPI00211201B3|nr:hypothetical protein [Natronoarchaeum rubrum]